MLSVLIPSVSVLNLVVYTEAAIIVVLLLLALWLLAQSVCWMEKYERARRERDEAKANLATIRRMSEIRVETVTRLRGFAQEP